MSKPYHSKFDAVFNLFTSFGYFENEEDNQNTINSIKENLNKHGVGIIDFLNAQYIIDNLVPDETKTIDNITFTLKRFVEDDYIVKDISFVYQENSYNYQERVKAFTLNDFKSMFAKANIELLDIFGDYNLNKFNSQYSERLIMIFM